MNDKLSEQVRLLLEEPPTNEDSPYSLARNGYHACMDRGRIEQLGVSPLLDTLTQLGVWPGPLQSPAWLPDTDTHWWDIMYALRRMGLSSDILINFSVSTDLRNSSRHIMSLDQPELGLAREFRNLRTTKTLKKDKFDQKQQFLGVFLALASLNLDGRAPNN